jgi:capsular polysaccharide biosynthesis protein
MENACYEMNIPVRRHPNGALRAEHYTGVNRQIQTPLAQDLELLRSHVPLAKLSVHNKIFISRRYSSRYTAIESDLEAILVRKGFHLVYPERLTFIQQVQLFSSASIVVGATGSALSNTVWMSEHSKLIVLSGTVPMNFMLWNRLNPRVTSYWQIDIVSLNKDQVIAAVFQALQSGD